MADYDLTKLDRPLGEYPNEVIGALVRANQMGAKVQYRIMREDEWSDNPFPGFYMTYTYRLAPEPLRPMSPPWDVLPEWVRAVARDDDGKVWGYDGAPETGQDEWMPKNARTIHLTEFRFDKGNMPWRSSLVLRPGGANG